MSAKDSDEIVAAEYVEQELLRQAVEMADRIICNGSDGDPDRLLLLTTKVAIAFVKKVEIMAQHAVYRKELLGQIEEEKRGCSSGG